MDKDYDELHSVATNLRCACITLGGMAMILFMLFVNPSGMPMRMLERMVLAFSVVGVMNFVLPAVPPKKVGKFSNT